MPLMFMISGYVHGRIDRFHDSRGYSHHTLRNFVSIYLPYLWISYFGWAVSLLIFRGSSNPINYNMAQFGELFRIPYIGFREYWFLCTLFQVKLVHIAFEYRFRSTVPCTVFWVMVFIALNLCRSSLPLWVYRFQFGMYFHAGYLLKTRNIITSERPPKLLWGVLMIAVAEVMYFMPSVHGHAASISVSALMSLGLFAVFYALKIRPALLVLPGSTSMVMFIVHDYVIFSMALLFKFAGLLRETPIAAYLLTFALAVAVPLLIVKLYRNVKAMRWIEYLFYPGNLLRH